MITLSTDQVLFSEPSWQVVVGGEFPADALVECYRTDEPEQRVAHYALFISTGEFPQ